MLGQMAGRTLTSIGAIGLAIVGLMDLIPGYAPPPWLNGPTYLVLGVGLVLFVRK